jgi:putative transposase
VLQTLMVKLRTSEKQHTLLLETMHRFNEACNYIAEIAFSIKSANKIKIQQIVYRDVRDKFGLSAQHAIRAIAKVAEAYKRDKSIKPEFSPDGAIVYDQRILSWKGLEAVSDLSLNGRLKIPISIGEYQKVRMNTRVRGQADLILRNGIFYLAVVVEAPEPSKFDTIDTLGIDMGIVNLATDSDGGNFSGEQTDRIIPIMLFPRKLLLKPKTLEK